MKGLKVQCDNFSEQNNGVIPHLSGLKHVSKR